MDLGKEKNDDSESEGKYLEVRKIINHKIWEEVWTPTFSIWRASISPSSTTSAVSK
jgi:hypothetical protein